MAGKGSKRRPALVSDEQVSQNWSRIFGDKKNRSDNPEKRKEARKDK